MRKILLISLGCDKNRVDSEKMLGLLNLKGYEITDDESEAEVIIVNSCCFINDAKQESIDTILDMARQKETGKCRALIVAGCMAQRYEKEIRETLPEVDACVGTGSIAKIGDVIEEVLQGQRDDILDDVDSLPLTDGKRLLTTGGHYAYLKIAEGCDKHCTYCAIPMVRGRYRSVPMESLLSEAKDLADMGVRELILVAEETTLYGTDLYGRKCLHELIHQLAQIRGIRWIRVLYCYPEEIYEELIQCMKDEKKFVHYLDLPIQHADDEILRRMGRHTTNADLRQMCREGKFKEDLLDRLSFEVVFIPPLRERGEDIILLFRLFALQMAEKYKMDRVVLDEGAKQLLMHYKWPGNVRQLKNITEQISVLSPERTITAQALSQFIPHDQESTQLATIHREGSGDHSFENEREILYKILFELRGNVNDMRREMSALKKQLDDVQTAKPTTVDPLPAPATAYPTPITQHPTPVASVEDAYAEEYIEPEKELESLNLNDLGKQMLEKALERNHGNRKKAAQELGISDRTLYRRLKQYGLDQ